jgi:hypothetical protein
MQKCKASEVDCDNNNSSCCSKSGVTCVVFLLFAISMRAKSCPVLDVFHTSHRCVSLPTHRKLDRVAYFYSAPSSFVRKAILLVPMSELLVETMMLRIFSARDAIHVSSHFASAILYSQIRCGLKIYKLFYKQKKNSSFTSLRANTFYLYITSREL